MSKASEKSNASPEQTNVSLSPPAKAGLAYALARGDLSVKQIAVHWSLPHETIDGFMRSEEGRELTGKFLRVAAGDTAARLAKTHAPQILNQLFADSTDIALPVGDRIRAAGLFINFHKAMESSGKGGGDENNPDLPTDAKEAKKLLEMQISELEKDKNDPKITQINDPT